jgi:hypothetical protein
LAKDVKNELDAALGMLSGKGKGQKGKKLKGAERKKMWEEVRALRKEYETVHAPYKLSSRGFVTDTDSATAQWSRVCWLSRKLVTIILSLH